MTTETYAKTNQPARLEAKKIPAARAKKSTAWSLGNELGPSQIGFSPYGTRKISGISTKGLGRLTNHDKMRAKARAGKLAIIAASRASRVLRISARRNHSHHTIPMTTPPLRRLELLSQETNSSNRMDRRAKSLIEDRKKRSKLFIKEFSFRPLPKAKAIAFDQESTYGDSMRTLARSNFATASFRNDRDLQQVNPVNNSPCSR